MEVYPKLTLVCFAKKGGAETIRLACAAGKIPFTNKVVTPVEFAELRASLPLGQLPVLEIEQEGHSKRVVPQSNAILRYVGSLSKHGLYPPDQASEIDSLLETMTEFERPFLTSAQGLVSTLISDQDWTTADMLAMRQRILTKHIPKYFAYFEHVLEQNNHQTDGWLVGESLTIADLKWHFLVSILQTGALDGIPATVTDDYPLMKKHIQKVISHPDIKAWYERFPEPPYPTFDYKPSKQ